MKTLMIIAIGITAILLLSSCKHSNSQSVMPVGIVQKNQPVDNEAEIYLAGGCFWGTEMYLRLLTGVVSVESGYANGYTEHPTYNEVCRGSGHAETVHVIYRPDVISLPTLLTAYFQTIDPTSKNRQGNDKGIQYRTGIYYMNEQDAVVINSSLNELQQKHSQPLAIETGPIVNFYRAEEEHQEYLINHPNGYCHIPLYLFDELHKEKAAHENGDARQHTKDTHYEKPTNTELKEHLTALQYAVTQQAATEPPFHNAYDKEFRAGIYCDVTTGQPLFVSTEKFNSGCGWPAFSRPIGNDVIEEREDCSLGMKRTEVLAKASGAHLGHVFPDGPKEKGGLRYCINSASLRFIPKEKMAEEGYGEYLKLLLENEENK